MAKTFPNISNATTKLARAGWKITQTTWNRAVFVATHPDKKDRILLALNGGTDKVALIEIVPPSAPPGSSGTFAHSISEALRLAQ